MDTLYLSDVDGTLIRGVDEMTPETASLIRQVVEKGLHFTLATGRSINGICEITTACSLKLPLITLNGAMIYDLNRNRAVKTFPIPQNSAKELCRIYEDAAVEFTTNVFIQGEQRSKTYYNFDKAYARPSQATNPDNGLRHDERCQVKTVLPHLSEGDSLFFCSAGNKASMKKVFFEMQAVPGLKSFLHQSPYNADRWFLDVVGEDSGKGEAALFLKNYLEASELVTFGDNLNDISMLSMADRSYTVPEAPPEVKAAATAVLSSSQNCVPEFLLSL